MSFGDLLREARIRAGFESYGALARYLREKDLDYSDEAIGHWERNTRAPQDRQIVLKLCRLLADKKGIVTFAQLEALLEALDWDRLAIDERLTLFPMLDDDPSIPNMPSKPHYARLIGRDTILQQVINGWHQAQSHRIVCLSGIGGIGKTAISYELMRHTMHMRQFDGLVWESLKSEHFIGTDITPKSALSDWDSILISYARQLNQTHLLSQSPSVIKQGLRDIFQNGKYLIVLDNLETLTALNTVAQDLYDLIGTGQSRVLITSRERLVGMPSVLDIPIGGLSITETQQLFFDEAQTRHAPDLLRADADLLKRVYQVTGGMPLAIQLIVTQFLLGIPLDTELDRLIGVTDEQQLYQFIYFAIWRKLSPNAQTLLLATGQIPSAMPRALLMKMSALAHADFDHAVTELVRSSLLTVESHLRAEQQRYAIHAMTFWFVNVPLYQAWQAQQDAL